jgi:predicted DNA binding CopG/RHH family protein
MRQIITKLLGTQRLDAAEEITEQPDTSRARIELRLTESELSMIRSIATAEGASANRWLVNLVRVHLTHRPQLGMVELRALGESNSRLLAIGRNLNQIARQANLDRRAPDRLTKERIDALHQLILSHTSEVTAVMRANLDRWALK